MSITIPDPHTLAVENARAAYKKTKKPLTRSFVMALSGGAFIGMGYIFYITSQQGLADGPLGPAKVLGGLCVSVGLILVVLTGSDLFTSTTMTVMPLYHKRVRPRRFFAHWGTSLAGNLVGALFLALLVFGAGQALSNGGAWGEVALHTAAGKAAHSIPESFLLGVLANIAVCAGVWIAQSGRSTADKILACLCPIPLFVAAGFEHSIANMFLLPLGLMCKYWGGDAFWNSEAVLASGHGLADYAAFTPGAVALNIGVVILGNIVGGGFILATYFWVAYLRDDDAADVYDAPLK